MRPLLTADPGVYDCRIWAYTATEVSAASCGSYTPKRPSVSGFESLQPFETLPLGEASTTGIVFRTQGPAAGKVCLTSAYAGQTAELTLDSTGVLTQRIRFLEGGTYFLSFRACDGDYRGPATEVFVDVEDPMIFGPFGPSPEDTVFELSDL